MATMRTFIASVWRWTTGTAWRRLIAVCGVAVMVTGLVVVAGADGDDASAGHQSRPTAAASRSVIASTPSSSAPPSTAALVPQRATSSRRALRFVPEDVPDNGSRAPLTGLPVVDPERLGRAAIAVKIDNLDLSVETARPQTGIAHADVVVEEIVEGGVTRFLALLHSTDSPEVGPIRSARTTDVQLLPAFGRPLFSYSGGNPGVLATVRAGSSIVDRGGEWDPAYARVRTRRAPHNLYMRPWEIWSLGGGSPPRVLASFRPRGQGSIVGTPVQGVNIRFRGQGADVTWTWHPVHERWLRTQRGTLHLDGSGFAVGPRNVIVMDVGYRPSPADPRSPEAVAVGSGAASVFTDGKLIEGTWHRPTVDAPLWFVDRQGHPISLSSGRTWIELARPGAASATFP